MKRSIETLAYLIDRRPPDDATVGDLALKYDETPTRIIDAIDVIKIVHGEPTQLPAVRWGES